MYEEIHIPDVANTCDQQMLFEEEEIAKICEE